MNAVCAARGLDSWVGSSGRLSQGAQFQTRRLADLVAVQFDCGVVGPGFPEPFEPSLPGAEAFDSVIEPAGVSGGWWQWFLNSEELFSLVVRCNAEIIRYTTRV